MWFRAFRFILPTLLAGPSLAQQSLDPSALVPIRGEPKNVAIDFVTGKRTTASTQATATSPQVIYNNTCTFPGGSFFTEVANCEDIYDEGRIPSQAPGSGSPVSFDSFSFGYCTYNASSFQCNIAFANNAGGSCFETTPVQPTPPPWSTSSVFKEVNLSALGLPGSTSNGQVACWIVSVQNLGLCIEADGDGVFDDNPSLDLFSFGFNHKMQNQGGFADGFMIAGDPIAAAPGSCSYNIPCGSDPFGGSCGTGLGTEDQFWVNADGTAIGSSPPTNCPEGLAQYGFGTNCYFFGGAPQNPFASLRLTMEGGRTCASCTAGTAYCRANPSLDGCIAAMQASGLPSVASPGAFSIGVVNAPATLSCIQFFGLSGPDYVPFANGQLCVAAPLIRLAVKPTGGVSTCDGTVSYSLAEVQAAAATAGVTLAPGMTIHQQAWISASPMGGSRTVSDGFRYTLCP